ncbi:hypothetical protein ARMGADRAFT_1085994 [Armillaria gallica]|uniref:BTB domain-containing protein n=1 Tax=Armillaria gallica TaxID=47427 RepID=A0A2H3CV20_ARMGA|nr:hypothetical protein ARMGADRAFT_1085994 [Armillaria gallica]
MSGSSSKLTGIKKHEAYYLKGGDIYFLVDECMFRVHRYFFERESSKFRQMFSCPTPPGKEPEGSSPSSAFKLSDITSEDFAHFVWVFYNPRHSLYDASTPVWVTILRLAYDWSFPEVKALAIRELERKTINLVERIILYQECKVDQSLLVPLFAKLCSRDDPLSTEESVRLGVETTVRIFQARERLRSSSLDGLKSPLPNNVDHTNVMQVVEEVWGGDTNGASGGWERLRVPRRRGRRMDLRTAGSVHDDLDRPLPKTQDDDAEADIVLPPVDSSTLTKKLSVRVKRLLSSTRRGKDSTVGV